MLKTFILLTILTASLQAFSKVEKLTFNLDYFKCAQSTHSLYKIESRAGVYSSAKVDLDLLGENFNVKMQNLLNDLKKISPARARFIEELSSNNENVQFKKSIKILRSSPPSNLLLPDGCEVNIAAATTLTRSPYNIIIDQDAYDRFDDDDKIYFWFNLALDIEQASFALGKVDYRFNEVEVDLTRARNFMSCWFSSECKPSTPQALHKIAIKKEYSLPVLEQGGVVMPVDNSLVFFENSGLIKSAKKVAETFWGSPSESYNSKAQVKSKTYPVEQIVQQGAFIGFNQRGELRCAPLINVEETFQKTKTFWNYSDRGAYPVSFPLCWNDDGQLTQGELKLDKDQSMKINVAGGTLELNHYDRLGDGLDYRIGFAFYDPQNIKWIFRTQGSIVFNNQMIEINGPLKLYPSGVVACARFSKKMSLKLKNGSRLEISEEEAKKDLFCFTPDGNFEKKYLYYDAIRLMALEVSLLK